MSDQITPAASSTSATPADRIKGCVKIVATMQPSPELKTDVQFLLNELLDLMQIVASLPMPRAPIAAPASAPAATPLAPAAVAPAAPAAPAATPAPAVNVTPKE